MGRVRGAVHLCCVLLVMVAVAWYLVMGLVSCSHVVQVTDRPAATSSGVDVFSVDRVDQPDPLDLHSFN